MRNGYRGLRASASLAALIALGAAMIFGGSTGADTRSRAASMPDFHCYCECESGGKMCAMKFCEIPKYEHRDWAMSCHKKSEMEMHASKPAANGAPSDKRSMEKHPRAILTAQR
jgi:hypothetical protein